MEWRLTELPASSEFLVVTGKASFRERIPERGWSSSTMGLCSSVSLADIEQQRLELVA